MPSITVRQAPVITTRSPSSRQPSRPPPRRRLIGADRILAEPLRPIGRQQAMGRSGHRILVDPAARHEDAADDVAVVARRGRHQQIIAQLAQGREIRLQRADRGSVAIDEDRIAAIAPACLDDVPAHPRRQLRQRLRRAGPGRQRQFIAIARTGHGQHPGMTGAEAYGIAPHQHMAARQRGMAAQLHLDRRGEPAQRIIGLRIVRRRHGEGGFRQVIFRGDHLQHRIVEPGIERHHRRRIAGEGRVGKGVDLSEAKTGHGDTPDGSPPSCRARTRADRAGCGQLVPSPESRVPRTPRCRRSG